MTATAVVEILVLGLQAVIWLAILGRAVADDAWVAARVALFPSVKELAPLVSAMVLALAYALGVIVDRCADTVFFSLDSSRDLPANIARMRLTVLHKSEGIAKFIEYQRSRLRIARGMVVNVALGTLSVVIYLVQKKSGAGVGWAVMVGVVTLLVTLYAAHRINVAFTKRLSNAYTMLLAEG